MRIIGEKVKPTTGGYGGLNYHFLNEEGAYGNDSEIIEVDESKPKPCLVRLPSGYRLWLAEADFKRGENS